MTQSPIPASTVEGNQSIHRVPLSKDLEGEAMQKALASYTPADSSIPAPSLSTVPSTSTTANYPLPAKKSCHVGPVPVIDMDGVILWAGSIGEVSDNDWSLRIRLVGASDYGWEDDKVTANAAAKAILPMDKLSRSEGPMLDVQWRDYSAPNLDREWWDVLVSALFALPKGSEVAINCIGGHGRTGTALSILAALTGVVKDGEDPVAWVRTHYCKEAVESETQLRYIEEVIGYEIPSRVYPLFRGSGGSAYGSGSAYGHYDTWDATTGKTRTYHNYTPPKPNHTAGASQRAWEPVGTKKDDPADLRTDEWGNLWKREVGKYGGVQWIFWGKPEEVILKKGEDREPSHPHRRRGKRRRKGRQRHRRVG